jgi:hypothetical protein
LHNRGVGSGFYDISLSHMWNRGDQHLQYQTTEVSFGGNLLRMTQSYKVCENGRTPCIANCEILKSNRLSMRAFS